MPLQCWRRSPALLWPSSHETLWSKYLRWPHFACNPVSTHLRQRAVALLRSLRFYHTVQPHLDASTSASGGSPSIPTFLPHTIVPAQPTHDALAMPAAPPIAGVPPVLESGTLYMQIDGQVLDAQASHLNTGSMIGYEPGCPLLSNPLNMEAAMDWQQDVQPAHKGIQDCECEDLICSIAWI